MITTNMKFIRRVLQTFVVLLILISSINIFPAYAQSSSQFSATAVVNKTIVKPNESFTLTFSVTNTSTAPITNLEIRIPFYQKVVDTITNVNINPPLNKLLNSYEYPAQFNNKSFIINNFSPGNTQQLSFGYTVVSSPTLANGMLTSFSLPAGWNDPVGLQAGTPYSLNYMRFDVYIAGSYSQSFQAPLPKLQNTQTALSNIKLNDKYYFPGSRSTNLKDITSENIAAFPNFKLETQDTLVEWLEPINFSAPEVAGRLVNFDSLCDISWGKVTFAAGQLGFLAKKAKITFKNSDFIANPRIKVKTNISNLTDIGGTFNKDSKEIIFTLPTLAEVALSPSLEFNEPIISTNETSINIKGKTASPSAAVYYSIDSSSEKRIDIVDLQTGEFDVPISDTKSANQVEVRTELKNGEKASKIILVKYNSVQPTVTSQPANVAASKNLSLLTNPIVLALVIVAIALTLVIGGYIYYLSYKKSKTKREAIDLSSLTLSSAMKTSPADKNLNKYLKQEKNGGSEASLRSDETNKPYSKESTPIKD